MKIAFIRAQNLNPFETINYLPLASQNQFTAFIAKNSHFEIENINFDKRRLFCLEDLIDYSPWPINSFLVQFISYFGRNHLFGLEKYLKDFDILHPAETFNDYSYQAIKAKEKYEKKVVVTCWENIPYFKKKPGFKNSTLKKMKMVKEKTDAFIAMTETAKKTLIAEGVPREKIFVVLCGVDLEKFKPQPKDQNLLKELNLAEEDFVVLFVGRITYEKGIYDLVNAAKILSCDPALKSRTLKFILAGKGPEEKKLQTLVSELHLENQIKIVGFIPHLKMPRVYSLADVFIAPSIPLPSWQEQFGHVLAESLACGKPVITTNSGSIPDVVGSAGILIPPKSPQSLSSEIKKFILDKGYLKEKSLATRVYAEENFNHLKISRQIDQIYHSLCPVGNSLDLTKEEKISKNNDKKI